MKEQHKYRINKKTEVEFIEELAVFIDHANLFNSNLILSGDYNQMIENDTKFKPFNLDVANKIIPTHSKTLITDFRFNDQSNRFFLKRAKYLKS